jgi:hypothetical protein
MNPAHQPGLFNNVSTTLIELWQKRECPPLPHQNPQHLHFIIIVNILIIITAVLANLGANKIGRQQIRPHIINHMIRTTTDTTLKSKFRLIQLQFLIASPHCFTLVIVIIYLYLPQCKLQQ